MDRPIGRATAFVPRLGKRFASTNSIRQAQELADELICAESAECAQLSLFSSLMEKIERELSLRELTSGSSVTPTWDAANFSGHKETQAEGPAADGAASKWLILANLERQTRAAQRQVAGDSSGKRRREERGDSADSPAQSFGAGNKRVAFTPRMG